MGDVGTRTLHVGLRVTDLDCSVAFYAALGYAEVGRVPETPIGQLVMLKLPDDPFVSLELVHDPDGEPVRQGGLNHLVLRVEDVRLAIRRLQDAGIGTDPPVIHAPDFVTCMLADPDGHRIELVQWPPGHPGGMTRADLGGTEERTAEEVVAEMLRRQQADDESALDLVAVDFVNHAAGPLGPQGREGLRQILGTIAADLGPVSLDQHHLVAEGDLVAQHLTLHGTHRGSSMPLLAGEPATGRPVAWTFMHLWRVADGLVVEHWACRDDMHLLEQVREL